MNIQPHNVVTISGIGCSSNLPGFINTYGMHTLHGRALAVATGVKMANHKLHVVVTGGDGEVSASEGIISFTRSGEMSTCCMWLWTTRFTA